MWFVIVCLLLLFFYSGLIFYYITGWKKLKPTEIIPVDPISVCIIIPARNEAENIKQCIDSILDQTYSSAHIEIIVVDDFSEDETALIVKSFSDERIKLIALKDFVSQEIKSYKKEAITIAINQTKAELIICTDADCTSGKRWIESIVSCYKQTDVVCIAAPVLIKEDGTFFNEIQALDMVSFSAIAASCIGQQQPVLCNGANFSFTRKAFLEVNGFENINHVSSGDDLLLLQKFKKHFPGKIAFCKNENAIVETLAAESMTNFMKQRLRWASKSASYSNKKITLILAGVYLFYISIAVNVCLCLIEKKYVYLLTAQLLFKFILDAIYLQPVLNFFKRRSLIAIFLPAQIFHLMYVIITGAASLFVPMKWKGRKVYR